MSPHNGERIGIIEDDLVVGGTLAHRLELEGYTPLWWRTGGEALKGLCAQRPDLVVCDILLPDMSGEDVFLQALPRLGGKPFLFVTGFGKIEDAVRLMKAGAVDYIVKPYALSDLLERIARLLKLQPRAAGDLGNSEAMRQVEMLLRRVADIDSSLQITGESGVGKEVAAKFVHQISTRADEPFVAVNCGAIPTELIESQLFGHERGAFTSAQARHHGFVERARNGILFLDEVGELPMLMQVKLLRLIQERVFTRVGGETAIKTSARIICATNTDLEAAVAEGRFRRDLYYRINVIPIAIPPFVTGLTTSCRSHNCSCASFRRRFNAISRALHRKLSRLCSIIAGPAMCGSCATVSSGQWRFRRHRGLASRRFFRPERPSRTGARSQRSRRSVTGPSATTSAPCSQMWTTASRRLRNVSA
jgi:DNA-binding NtrC family response regulator